MVNNMNFNEVSQKRQLHTIRGNVHGSSMARWKARGRLPISANWTFFASYHGWGAMSRYWSKLRCFKGGGSLWTQISGGKGRPPPTIFGTRTRKVESLGYRMVKKLPKSSTGWVGCTNVTDDRQTTVRQTTDGIAIACSERNVVTFAKNWDTILLIACIFCYSIRMKLIIYYVTLY